MWFNVFDTATIYNEETSDSPMPQHVISTVCSKLKGHNGDPCNVFFFLNDKLQKLQNLKMETLMSDNYFSDSNNISEHSII